MLWIITTEIPFFISFLSFVGQRHINGKISPLYLTGKNIFINYNRKEVKKVYYTNKFSIKGMGLPDLERFEYDGVERRGDLIVQLRRAKQNIRTSNH